MSNKIEGLIRCLVELVDDLDELDLDWRLTTVPFGDLTFKHLGDDVVSTQPFVHEREAAQQQIREMPRFSGGGNYGESSIEAMFAGLAKSYRPRAVKIIVLLTDEPALTSSQTTPEAVDRGLHDAEAICFVASPPELRYFQDWAHRHGGEWYQIGPTMDFELLRSLLSRLATVAREVHTLAGGSVKRYLELGSGS